MIKKNAPILRLSFLFLSISFLLSSCAVGNEDKDLNEYNLPVTISIPSDATITNNFKKSENPGQEILRQVSIKNESTYGLYVSMYEKETEHTIEDIVKHDLLFEEVFAEKNNKKFELIKEDKSGYIYEDDKGFHFYHYLI